MSTEVIKEFLIALGFKVDEASAKKAQAAASRVEQAMVGADKRITDAQTVGTAKRIVQANREAGVRTKGAAALIADHNQRQKAVAAYTEAEKVAAQARAKVAKEEAAGGATQAAVFAARMAGMAVAAAGFAAAVGFAIYKVTDAFAGLQRTSERTGASVQNIRGLAFAFSQVGGNSEHAVAALENFKKALRTNPGTGAFVRALGVSTDGDTFDVLSGALDKIQERHPYETGAQLANILGVSEEQFELLTRYKKEMKESKELHDRITKAFGVNAKEMGDDSARLTRSMGVVGLISRTAGEKMASLFLPILERMTLAVQRWIETHPEVIEKVFTAIGAATDAVGRGFLWLIEKGGELYEFLADKAAEMNKDGSFTRAWERVVRIFERVVGAIKTVITWLKELDRATDMSAGLDAIKKLFGWLESKTSGTVQSGLSTIGAIDQGTDTGVGIPAERAAAEAREKPGLLRRGWEATKRGVAKVFGGESGAAATGTGTGVGHLAPKAERAAYIRHKAAKLGIDPETALRVAQSEGFNTYSGDKDGTGAYTSFGDFQLHFAGRGGGMSSKGMGDDLLREKGIDARDPKTWKEQADYALENARRKGWGAWHGAARVGIGNRQGIGTYTGPVPPLPEAVVTKKPGPQPDGTFWDGQRTYRKGADGHLTPDIAYAKPDAKVLNFPKLTPGNFDVNAALKPAAPMGASSIDSSSRSVNQTINNNVKIEGSGDPANDARHTERALGRSSELSLRNAQTAIR